MKRVLVHHGKHGRTHYDATGANIVDAFCRMFKDLDEADYYEDMEKMQHLRLLSEARQGDQSCARRLIEARSDYEYEEFSLEDVE